MPAYWCCATPSTPSRNRTAITPVPPTTVAGRLQVEMFKRRLKQKQLAELLEVGESRLSEVLRGRRPANGDFLRRMYKKLGIPAAEVLELTA